MNTELTVLEYLQRQIDGTLPPAQRSTVTSKARFTVDC